jgi:hypothetical protein
MRRGERISAMPDPGHDKRVLDELAAGLERLMTEQHVAEVGKLNAQRCIDLAHEIGNRYGYGGEAVWRLIGSIPPLPFHMECDACGKWASSDEVLTTGMRHENFDGGQISTSPMGWQTTIWYPADIAAPGAVMKVDVRCPDCAASKSADA